MHFPQKEAFIFIKTLNGREATESKMAKTPYDCVTYPFQSWIFYKTRLSCNVYTQNIKKYLCFFYKLFFENCVYLELTNRRPSPLPKREFSTSQVTNKGLIYGDLRIFIHLKSV